MKYLPKLWLLVCLCAFGAANARGDAAKSHLQGGFGFGAVAPYPVTTYPYALQGVLEGTYHWKMFGLSILATATSSPKTGGTYWFGSSAGGYQQTLLEPRVYFGILHFGLTLGLNLSEGSSGQIQSIPAYGAMAGVEIPIGRFSLGADARYLHQSSGTNPSPLATVLMFRFRF